MIICTDYPDGNHRISCPECDRSERDRTLGITVEAGSGVAHCFRCGLVETWRGRQTTNRPGKAISRNVAPSKRCELSEGGRALWNACTGLRGTIGESYLHARRCVEPPADGAVRFAGNLRHPSGYVGPALVALVTHAVTRRPLTLHRT